MRDLMAPPRAVRYAHTGTHRRSGRISRFETVILFGVAVYLWLR